MPEMPLPITSVMGDLFTVEESLSPYAEFRRRHNIRTSNEADFLPPWIAWSGDELGAVLEEDDPNLIAYGETEKEAVFELAVNLRLEGFNSFSWEI